MIRKQNGYSIIEVIVSLLLILSSMGAYLSYYSAALKISSNVQVGDSERLLVTQIQHQIQNSIHLNMVNFDFATDTSGPTNSASDYLDVTKLPMAWGPGVNTAVANCQNCPGRYGYMIQPLSGAEPGLYLVTVRMTHVSWSQQTPNYKDFSFMASAK